MPADARKTYLPFSAPHITNAELREVAKTLKSGWLTTGKRARLFEERFAEYVGSRHAVSVASGTAALFLSLLVEGVGPGDEVITSPFTFISTANVVHHLGAKPVFADIDPETFNIDPARAASAVTPRTKVLMPVHYSGQPCEMPTIMTLARRHRLRVVEDAAHALGAEINGKRVGSSGNLTCFSLFPTKNITAGEGGVITLNDGRKAKRLMRLRLHGMSKDGWKRYAKEGSWYYEVHEAGYKYNLADLNAALGLVQLKKLDAMNRKRERLARRYTRRLASIPGIRTVEVRPRLRSSWHLFPIHVDGDVLGIDRNRLVKALWKRNIGTSVHFIPLHLQPFYQRQFGYRPGDFPVTEKVYAGILSLPLFPRMTNRDVDDVVAAIQEAAS
jgi:dTDP-4-amino-4,6-dideoxygalactose transaminase